MSEPRNDRARITVVVPVRDEASTVGVSLESLASQSLGPEQIDVLVYDGLSSDETAEVARGWGSRFSWHRFEVVSNPELTVPHALNAALEVTQTTYFTRLDGRTRLSPDYLETCISEIEARGARTAAGGLFVAEAQGPGAEAIASAVTHPLGVGKGFRTLTASSEVPHHPFAVWRADDVRSLGGFDTELTRNQDDEFSMRACAQGFRIYAVAPAFATYRPRERYRGLAMQYYQYGLWKSAVGRERGLFPIRSLAPGGVTVLWALSAAALRRSRWPLILLVAVYAVAGILASRNRSAAGPVRTAFALALVHLAYGGGILSGAIWPRLARTRLGSIRVR